MRKFFLGWFATVMAFACAAGIATVIRWDDPLGGAAMAVICGLISWRTWVARKRPPAPPEPRPWER